MSGECVDYLLLQERGQGMTERERQLCGTPPPFFLSSTSELLVVYKTGLDVESLGFYAAYETSGRRLSLHKSVCILNSDLQYLFIAALQPYSII